MQTDSSKPAAPVRLTFLGTGGSFGVPEVACDCHVCKSPDPRDQRRRCAIAVTCGDVTVIVDTPPDFREQCLAHGILGVNAVFYTHFHADHIMGADDLRRFNKIQQSALPIYLDDHTRDTFESIFHYAIDKDHAAHLIRPRFCLSRCEPKDVDFAGFSVRALTVMHGDLPISGFLFTEHASGKRVAYLTDCKHLPEETRRLVTSVDVLILSALWQEWTHASHLNVEEALGLAQELQPKRLYLTHVTHHMGTFAEVQPTLPANTRLAYDGLTITP